MARSNLPGATAPSAPEPVAPEPGSPEPGGAAHLPEGAASRAWRLMDRLVLGAALVGLLVPGAMFAAGIRGEAIENRPLLEMPALTVDGLLDASWAKGVDAHLADNVWLRRVAVRLRGEAYFRTGGTGNPQVLRGRDGWLFTRREFEVPCSTSAAEIRESLVRAAAALAARGATFRVVAIPDKHSIYPEQVGANPFPPACTESQRPALRAALAELGGVSIDGWTILEAAKAADPARPLYFRADTHWTPYGALQVVRALVTSIDLSLWDEAAVRLEPGRRRTFDLARLIGIVRSQRFDRVVVRPGVDPARTDVPVPFDLSNAPSVFRTTVPAGVPSIGGRTLIIHDSYFRTQIPLVSPFFADAVWVHASDMQRHPEVATLLGPFDTIIVQRVERFLYTDDVERMLSDPGL